MLARCHCVKIIFYTLVSEANEFTNSPSASEFFILKNKKSNLIARKRNVASWPLVDRLSQGIAEQLRHSF